ncbi:hypothetical protein ACHAW6_008160 [Cyclotella cf. meneghiniana]
MKIDGQPTNEDLNKLTRELTEHSNHKWRRVTWTHPNDNLGYITFSHGGTPFIMPTNPGPYPATVNATNAAIHECQVAEHKAKLLEFEMYMEVEMALQNAIVKSIDEEWIEELRSKNMDTCTAHLVKCSNISIEWEATWTT